MNQKLTQPNETNPLVFLDVKIGDEFMGRILIELRKDVVPKSAENFRALCTGEKGMGTMRTNLHYKGTKFHKVTRMYCAQGGDVVNFDGTCGDSIYGPIFADENFELPHDEGAVSMANYGTPNTNNSQFVITTVPCEVLNGTNVVVGRVIRGLGVITEMENAVDEDCKPKKDFIVYDCGEIQPGEDFEYIDADETEFRTTPFPADWSRKFETIETDEMLSILLSMRKVGNNYFGQKKFNDAKRKYRKATRYCKFFKERFNREEMKHLEYNDTDLKKLDDFNVVNTVNFAATELKLEEYASAKAAATDAINIDDKAGKAYWRRGQAQIGLKNYDEAIEDLNKALEIIPDNAQIIADLNRVKKIKSDYDRQTANKMKKLFN